MERLLLAALIILFIACGGEDPGNNNNQTQSAMDAVCPDSISLTSVDIYLYYGSDTTPAKTFSEFYLYNVNDQLSKKQEYVSNSLFFNTFYLYNSTDQLQKEEVRPTKNASSSPNVTTRHFYGLGNKLSNSNTTAITIDITQQDTVYSRKDYLYGISDFDFVRLNDAGDSSFYRVDELAYNIKIYDNSVAPRRLVRLHEYEAYEYNGCYSRLITNAELGSEPTKFWLLKTVSDITADEWNNIISKDVRLGYEYEFDENGQVHSRTEINYIANERRVMVYEYTIQ